MWQPFGYVYFSGFRVCVASRPFAFLATSNSETPRSVPAIQYLPSRYSTSAAAASSSPAAVSFPFPTASSAASIAATPPIARKRLPPVSPLGTMSVSPCTTSIDSASMPSLSESTCLKLVM